jgi:hypothetical protein
MEPNAWQQVQQVVVEAHSDELMDAVATLLRAHYDKVTVRQSPRTRGTQLYLVYATNPQHRR